MGAVALDSGESTSDEHDGPLLSISLSEPSEGLTGWVVVDSLVESMAMGGTRMTDAVTEDEVHELARAMTTKLALVGLPIGGAKAGIRSVPGQRDRGQVLRAFGRTVAPLLRGGVYLGCDQGTTHADRDAFFVEAGFDVRRDTRASWLPTDWASFWEPLVDITGFGVVVGTLTALEVTHRPGSRRAVIQGFGTVGRAVAKTLEDHGHRIVGLADVHGTIQFPEGLPVEALRSVTDTAGSIDRSRLPDGVTVSDEPEAWLDIDTDVLVLAANGNAVRRDNVHRVRAGLVVEGGNLCCTREAKATLAGRGVVVLPDVVANVGAAGVTGCVLTGTVPFDLPLPQMVSWLFDWVEQHVRRNSHEVLEIAAAHGAPHDDDPVQVLLAARRPAGR